ncbi:hypothetical protein B0H67DRAFT_554919 [Lasiosphaeris hirsuta]|uniref:RRM domain-containing protein n=1 Tax=Lasiosphaeris hirsuta TaxID=260670 RepID=A0AA40DPI8_9PEZI|nr:hypothetical protein B0H67DRAFT_554919 [Lasiosphaeris hirsuta]
MAFNTRPHSRIFGINHLSAALRVTSSFPGFGTRSSLDFTHGRGLNAKVFTWRGLLTRIIAQPSSSPQRDKPHQNPANMSNGKRAGVGADAAAGAGVGARAGAGTGEGVDAGEGPASDSGYGLGLGSGLGLGIVGVDVGVPGVGAGASLSDGGFNGVHYGASRNRNVTAPALGPGQPLRREFLRPPSRAHARPISRDAYRETLSRRTASPSGPGFVTVAPVPAAPVSAPAPREPTQSLILRDQQQSAQPGLQSSWSGSPDSFSDFYPVTSAVAPSRPAVSSPPLAPLLPAPFSASAFSAVPAAFSSSAPAQLYDEPGAHQRGLSGVNPTHGAALARNAGFFGNRLPLAPLSARELAIFRPLEPYVPQVATRQPVVLSVAPPPVVPPVPRHDQHPATSSAHVVRAPPTGLRGNTIPPCTREHFRTPSGRITHGFPPGYHRDSLRRRARNLSICQNPSSYPIGPAIAVTRQLAPASVRGPGTTMQVARRVATAPRAGRAQGSDLTNCSVWFHNLPADVTLAELLDAVAAHRPGRVFKAAVFPPRADYPGGPAAAAQVTFFSRQGFDALLRATNAAGGLRVPRAGGPARYAGARPNRQRYTPPEVGSLLHSRVLVVMGPAGIVNRRNLEATFRRQILGRWETVRVVEGLAGDQACLEWHFAGWRGQAEAALGVVRAWFGADGVRCYWGTDPCGFV